jgi:MFS family permease
MTFAALAPTITFELVAMIFVGANGIAFASVCSSRLQLQAAPEMRGRVMALWSVAVVGSRPLGGPVVGYVSQHLGPRAGLGLGAMTVFLLALPIWWLLNRVFQSTTDEGISGLSSPVAIPPLGLDISTESRF